MARVASVAMPWVLRLATKKGQHGVVEVLDIMDVKDAEEAEEAEEATVATAEEEDDDVVADAGERARRHSVGMRLSSRRRVLLAVRVWQRFFCGPRPPRIGG